MRFFKSLVVALLAVAPTATALTVPENYHTERSIGQRDVNTDFPEDNYDSSQLDKRAGNLNIYVAYGKRRKPHEAKHWMIVTAPEGTNEATYYHLTGGPTQNKPFSRSIQAGKRLDSNGITETFHIGTVPDKEKNKIKSISQRTPLPSTGENCQNYVVNMIHEMEAKSLVQAGWATHFQSLVEDIRSPSPEPVDTAVSR